VRLYLHARPLFLQQHRDARIGSSIRVTLRQFSEREVAAASARSAGPSEVAANVLVEGEAEFGGYEDRGRN